MKRTVRSSTIKFMADPAAAVLLVMFFYFLSSHFTRLPHMYIAIPDPSLTSESAAPDASEKVSTDNIPFCKAELNDIIEEVEKMDVEENTVKMIKEKLNEKRKRKMPVIDQEKKKNIQKQGSSSSQSTPRPSSSLGSKFTANSSYKATPSSTPARPAPRTASKKSFERENEERNLWLVNIKDAQKRPVDDPEYDSRTLFIPSSAWAKYDDKCWAHLTNDEREIYKKIKEKR